MGGGEGEGAGAGRSWVSALCVPGARAHHLCAACAHTSILHSLCAALRTTGWDDYAATGVAKELWDGVV